MAASPVNAIPAVEVPIDVPQDNIGSWFDESVEPQLETSIGDPLPRFPAELKRIPNWILWKREPRGSDGDFTKVPYQIDGRTPARANDASTWSQFKDAAKQVGEINEDGGIGFQLGLDGCGYVALDLDACWDPRRKYLASWAKEFLDRHPSYIEITPSGNGLRAIYRGKLALPDGKHVWSSGPLPGLDWLKADKITQAEVFVGRKYITVTGNTPGPPQPIADYDGWFSELQTLSRPKSKSNNAAKLDDETPIPKGQRNIQLFSIAGRLRWAGLDAEGILDALRSINSKRCKPPLPDDELKGMANGAGKYPAPEPDVPQIHEPVEQGVADMPLECLDGYLGEICRTRMSDFPRAYAWPALLAAASVYVPRETKSRTNLYVVLDGPVHSGKSSAFERAFHLMSVNKPTLMALKTGSAEGLAEFTGDAGGAARLLYPDELAHLLEKSMIENSSLPRFLTTSFYQDQQTLTVAKRKVVNFNARLSIAGGTVDSEFGDLFGHRSTGGLHDRFLFGKCPGGFQYLWRDFSEEAPAFVPANDEWDELLGNKYPQPIPVTLDASVFSTRDRWIKELHIEPRVAEIALRCAVIAASFDSRSVLTAEMLAPALELAKYEMKVRTILQPNPGENPEARCAFALRTWLTQNAPKGEWVARREAYRGIHADKFGPGIFDRALFHLASNGEIEMHRAGRTKVIRLLVEESVTEKVVTSGDTSGYVN